MLLFSRYALFLLTLSMVVSSWGGEQDLPDATSMETKETYLKPLLVSLPDESAFVTALESMGDAEAVRLDALEMQLRFGHPTKKEAVSMLEEVKERKTKLSWLCDAGLQHYENNAHVRNFRGNVYYDNLHREVDGVKEWHLAVSLDSDYADPYNNLGMHYFHVGNYVLGFQNMDRALELKPNNPDFCFNMAQNYLIFGPEVEKKRGWSPKRVYKEAMKLSRRAVKGAPDDYQLLEDYAVNFLAAERFGVKANWKDAAKAWQAAREHAPNKVKTFYTWLNEGRVWKRQGRKKDARRCFEEALKIAPDNKVTKRLLEGLGDDA